MRNKGEKALDTSLLIQRPKWVSLSSALMSSGDRRMEAENYLSDGYQLKLKFEMRAKDCATLGSIANVWQPHRLKGTQVGPKYGVPFLAATQVFDSRPAPRKFLSLEQTEKSEQRFLKAGTIVVTCSGSVGRATLSHRPHEGVLITHDLLRIEPKDKKWWGWLYAFFRSKTARRKMIASQYGHIIKHLEVSHLNSVLVPQLSDAELKHFERLATAVFNSRIESFEALTEAEQIYKSSFPSYAPPPVGKTFAVSSASLFTKRMRLEASAHAPTATELESCFKKDAVKTQRLGDLVERIFVPGRFKHIYGDRGVPYLDSADILEVSPEITKFLLTMGSKDQASYKVENGWILMPCSGQVYGNIGQVVMSSRWHEEKILSNHILRIVPKTEGISPEYLLCALGHPELGRPLVIRNAFGSSVPEISPDDVAEVIVPRLRAGLEEQITIKMRVAVGAREKADVLEEEIIAEADELIQKFLGS